MTKAYSAVCAESAAAHRSSFNNTAAAGALTLSVCELTAVSVFSTAYRYLAANYLLFRLLLRKCAMCKHR